jgi:hypothetical protein
MPIKMKFDYLNKSLADKVDMSKRPAEEVRMDISSSVIMD